MTAPAATLHDCRIRPEGRGVEVLDFLIGDLRTMQQSIEHDGTVSANIADAVERNMLLLLDSISPEIRRVIAQIERYNAAPKLGPRL